MASRRISQFTDMAREWFIENSAFTQDKASLQNTFLLIILFSILRVLNTHTNVYTHV